MKLRGAILVAMSLLFALTAVALMRRSDGAAAAQVVVARVALKFGDRIAPDSLAVARYPANLVPAGAFSAIDTIAGPNDTRVALRSIVAGEPILASSISPKGGGGTLSMLIGEGMRATTIPVNEVKGVAGLIHISDHVDVLLTRDDHSRTDVLLENVKVLAIDQRADQEKTDKPAVPKAVTLEVSPEDAQRLALGGSIGALSLALRNSASADLSEQRGLSAAELTPHGPTKAAPRPARETKSARSLEILRGTESTVYDVSEATAAPEPKEPAARQHMPPASSRTGRTLKAAVRSQ